MTPADWQTLAERFEAADEETIYECVRDLLCFVTLKRGRITYADTIDRAENSRLPDLLLGAVVACVPSGWRVTHANQKIGGSPVTLRLWGEWGEGMEAPENVCSIAPTLVTALGAAVCRAWAEVAGKDVA